MSQDSVLQGTWPYPFWIAHRGAGELAPENTMTAFQVGAQHGYRMFECDVKLSADGLPFLLHDDTLKRTTNQAEVLGQDGEALASNYTWDVLCTLDAGSWHSEAFAGEPIPTLKTLAKWCLDKHLMLNIEIKPTPGTSALTGHVVARQAAALWQDHQVPPLLTSFDMEALRSVRQAQPELPRGLLLETLTEGWLENAIELGCVVVVCQHHLWNKHNLAQVKAAGLRSLSYTVNTPEEAQRLIELETDGIITDRLDLFSAD